MNNNYQNIFSREYIDELTSKVQQANIKEYFNEDYFSNSEKNPPGKSVIQLNANIELRLPSSNIENNDIENSQIIYNELKSLNETQASDPRLWTYLTHMTFWKYMRKRWPVEKFEDEAEELLDDLSTKNRQINFILTRYFLLTPNRRRLLRNGISRLWWYAHLTYDKNRKDPYELTKVLLSHQDIAQNLLERSLGSNKQVLSSILNFLKDNQSLSREEIREMIKEINLVGGVKNLHILDENEITKVFI